MDVAQAARCLEKLGHPTRLEIVRLLVRAGPEGLPVGDVRKHLGIPASTLSHHILHLTSAGLVRQQREVRVLRCTPNYRLMEMLVAMLTEKCCAGVEPAVSKRRAGRYQGSVLKTHTDRVRFSPVRQGSHERCSASARQPGALRR